MSKRVTIAKAGLAAIAGVVALSAGVAQAQPYGYYGMGSGGYSYDACKREKTGRGTVGALIGGTIGAVIGSNAAARNARTEGSLLGGAVGAAIGAGVGNSSAACASGQYTTPPPPPPPPVSSSYYERRDGGYYGRDDYASYEDDYAYGRRGERYRLSGDGVDADGCTLAESPIYMPDGRTQTRFVRVCRDSSGRYAVVD
ncbi:hypothetical protein [Phenylobacterium sp.]|uniref:hypothetical protein n=1 Tax=Phenylobacterium sp. TaxID=1871053 RepID=UPI002810C967|nr:hypothetical protein [Phenylobacterium sp.]